MSFSIFHFGQSLDIATWSPWQFTHFGSFWQSSKLCPSSPHPAQTAFPLHEFFVSKLKKIAIWGWQTPQLPRPEKAPKYLELMLSNMLRPTFVQNLVVLTWTRASAALDWLTLPSSIKTTRPDPPPPPPLHPNPPPSKFKPNSTAWSNRFSSGTPCVTLWNSLCSIPVTWVSTHNY